MLEMFYSFKVKTYESEVFFYEILKQASPDNTVYIITNDMQYSNSGFSNIDLNEIQVHDSSALQTPQHLDENLFGLNSHDENEFVGGFSNSIIDNYHDDSDILTENLNFEKEDILNDSISSLDLEKFVVDQNDIKEDSIKTEVLTEVCLSNFETITKQEDKIPETKNIVKKKLKVLPKSCKVCQKRFYTEFKLKEHMRKHSNETPFKCNFENCLKSFKSKMGLIEHETKHTGVFKFSCNTCNKGFSCKSYLVVHQRVHSNDKKYKCEQCGQHFKSKQAQVDHMNRHLGITPFNCCHCGRGFITKAACIHHEKLHTEPPNRQYPCEICNKFFVSKSYLNVHLKIHKNIRDFICTVCEKAFLTSKDLKIHLTMHTGEKKILCEICGKSFARRDTLRAHTRAHTGERPYK